MTLRNAALLLLPLLAAGCSKVGDITVGGITAVRSACPVVGVPAGTGDITMFSPATSTDGSAIDVSATMTNVRGTCNDTGDDIATAVTFEVQARRTRTDIARDVELPFFVTVVRGGTSVVAKRVASVVVHFNAGQAVANAQGQGSAFVSKTAATLPKDVRDRLTRPRKAGDSDAAIDPLAQPEVRTAVLAASFEALVGFQLTDAQLRYNATR